MDYVSASIDAVHSINPHILVLQGAGITSAEDVYPLIYHGAQATGASSSIARAEDREGLIDEMIGAVRRAAQDRERNRSDR